MARKQRTHKAAQKRFKVTKSGKLMHRSHYLRHKRSNKSKGQIRSLKMMKLVEGTIEKRIKRLLGIM